MTTTTAADLDALPLMLTVAEAADLLRLSQYAVRKAVADGTIRGLRVGHSIRIPAAAIRDLLALD